MKYKAATGIMLVLLLIGMLILAFDIQQVRTQLRTIIVPDDFSTIQAAINNATSGDTVQVRNGTYTENVVVNKTLDVIGEGSSVTIVNASNPNKHVFEITADGVRLEDFKIVNATGLNSAGVYVKERHWHPSPLSYIKTIESWLL